MHRVMTLALALLMLLASLALAADAPGLKFRVIVGSFDDKSEHGWYHGPSPGDGMADMLITALVKTGKFRVFERAALSEIMAEKNLSMSDLANPGADAALKLEIGDILVKGVITEFGYWADTVTKTEKSKSLSLGTKDFSFSNSKAFDDHVVGKATRKVIDAVVEKLEEQVKAMPWSGVLITADEFLFIDGGTELGIESGMVFDVKRKTKEVKHPKTGKVLKVLYETVGSVKATEVEDGITTVVAVSGSGFQTGDTVEIKK